MINRFFSSKKQYVGTHLQIQSLLTMLETLDEFADANPFTRGGRIDNYDAAELAATLENFLLSLKEIDPRD